MTSKKKNFYSIYKKTKKDIVPLATFDSREDVKRYLKIKKSRFYKMLKTSKDWDNVSSGTVLLFKDTY